MGETGIDAAGRRRAAVDAALALAATALSWSILAGVDGVPAAGWLAATVHTGAIAFRRRAPLATYAVSTAAGLLYIASSWPMVGLGLAAVVAVYSLAAYDTRRRSLVCVAAGGLGLLLAIAVSDASPDTSTVVGDELVLVAAWAVGDSTRRRRELAALYRQRAIELEAAQSELARQAVTLERLRIARELHDIVAHSMSVIAVQAGTGRLVVDDDPAQAREVLAAIEQLSREAMNDLRRLLGVLRDPDADAVPLEPAPSLGDVDGLVAAAAAAGTSVEVRTSGTRRPLAPGAELAAYRILQEALTNVRRHAPGAAATVELAFGPADVTITVANDTAGSGPGGSGLGLVGMRERAGLFGGTVDAGRRPDGTFLLEAHLPYDGGAR